MLSSSGFFKFRRQSFSIQTIWPLKESGCTNPNPQSRNKNAWSTSSKLPNRCLQCAPNVAKEMNQGTGELEQSRKSPSCSLDSSCWASASAPSCVIWSSSRQVGWLNLVPVQKHQGTLHSVCRGRWPLAPSETLEGLLQILGQASLSIHWNLKAVWHQVCIAVPQDSRAVELFKFSVINHFLKLLSLALETQDLWRKWELLPVLTTVSTARSIIT